MTWTVKFTEKALKDLKKLDKSVAKKISYYLRDKIAQDADPRRFGKPLKSKLAGLWRYRIDDYRILCKIEDNELTVLVLKVAHRRAVYS